MHSEVNCVAVGVCRDAIIVPLMNCGTSVFAGLVIFSVLGFMAHETGAEIKDVVTQGKYFVCLSGSHLGCHRSTKIGL